jgi:hypothetical protein
MMDEALDRIEKVTDDAFGWLETNVRRLGKRLPSRPGARQPRSVVTGERGRSRRSDGVGDTFQRPSPFSSVLSHSGSCLLPAKRTGRETSRA